MASEECGKDTSTCLWCSGQSSLNWDLGCHCGSSYISGVVFSCHLHSVWDEFCSFIGKKPQSWKYGNTIWKWMFFSCCPNTDPWQSRKNNNEKSLRVVKETQLKLWLQPSLGVEAVHYCGCRRRWLLGEGKATAANACQRDKTESCSLRADTVDSHVREK